MIMLALMNNYHIFKNPAQPGGLTRDPADPGLEPGQIDEKPARNLARQNPVDPGLGRP